MIRIAVIAALPGELRPLVRGWRRDSGNGVDSWRRTHGRGEWIAACAGAGAAAAARALAEIERGGAVSAVVSAGWAGALREEFAAGRAYRVGGVVEARTGERFPAAGGPGDCWVATTDRVADAEEKRRLAAATGAGLVDMEAASVARWAGIRGVPFYCVKGVSDALDEQLPDFKDFISAEGRLQWLRFVRFALVRPGQWPALARLGRNSRRAAQGLGEAVLALLEGPAGGPKGD